MSNKLTLALIIGSLREASINRIFAEYIVSQLPEHIEVDEVNISDLPVYNQDFDDRQIDSYDRVRQQLKTADAVLIVTPEHNRTIPAALKNIIDIGSRPYGEGVWQDKKVVIATASPSSFGGRSSGLDVRKSLHSLAANVMIAPEVYLSSATKSLDEGQVTSERTQKYLKGFAQAVAEFIEP